VARCVAVEAGQYTIQKLSRLIGTLITNGARPRIVEALLTLILRWADRQYVMN